VRTDGGALVIGCIAAYVCAFAWEDFPEIDDPAPAPENVLFNRCPD
jgi:hypothetical protein